MKKYIIGISVVLMSFIACIDINDFGGLNDPGDFDQLQISADFDWQTSRNVSFYINSQNATMVRIMSVDSSIVYHKGYYNGTAQTYNIVVNLPQYTDTVRINSDVIPINQDIIEHTIYGYKSGLKSVTADYSLEFDGENDYVEIDNTLIYDYPFTISAWVKSDAFADEDEDMAIVNIADPDKDNRYFGIYIGSDENGRACLRARNGSEKTIYSQSSILDGQWHQVTAVYEKKNKRYLYVDGEYENFDGRKVDFASSMDMTTFGRWGDNTPNSYFGGNIDEVQVWSKALSSNEVSYYFENKPVGSENKLVGYWNFDSGAGSTVTDITSNNPAGSINGAVWQEDNAGGSGGGSGGGGNEEDDTDGDGILNGDDDYPNNSGLAFNNYYPANGYGTLAFEDLWPGLGDYDFNDLVIDYRFTSLITPDNNVKEIHGSFILRAIGATLHNGFGFQFDNSNVTGGALTVSGYQLNQDYITLAANGLEANQNLPTVIVFDDAYDILPNPGGQSGVNTVVGSLDVEPDTINIVINLDNATDQAEFNIANFNPFLIVDQDRGVEVHLIDHTPTALANVDLFGTFHDNSVPEFGSYYKTTANFPWAINIYESFDYPIEKRDIVDAYLKFAEWAQSSGEDFADWYQDKDDYRNGTYIY